MPVSYAVIAVLTLRQAISRAARADAARQPVASQASGFIRINYVVSQFVPAVPAYAPGRSEGSHADR